jgi:DNA polymerase-3 subunit gamma/tau
MAEETRKTSYVGLARQYRPQTFADLVGQDQVGASLSRQILQDKVAQAYIFSGPRGVGKTSTARILAKSLNCRKGMSPVPCGVCDQCVSITNGSSMDVIEIDGASNNSVDNIRELQETINQNPFSALKKIYIIDEVHMLSKGAFNALLKTLEEPPSFVIFIFATTEFERIPETIKSRCQAFQFGRISLDDLIKRLDYVAEAEHIQMDPGEKRNILEAIAYAVDGGMRDAMMALDQLRALGDGHLVLDDVARFLGVVEHDQLLRTVEMLHHRDTRGLLEMVSQLVERGRDLERFVKNLLGFLRDLMILKSGGGEDLVSLTGEKMTRARNLLWQTDEFGRRSEVLNYSELLNFIQVFMSLEAQIKEAVQVRIHIEFAFVKLTAVEPVVSIAHLLENFDRLTATAGRPQAFAAPVAPPPQAPPPPAAPQSPTPPASFAPPPAAPPRQPVVAPPAGTPPPPKPVTPDLFGRSAAPESGAASPQGLVDASGLWQQVMARRQDLGMGFIALNDSRCLGLNGDLLCIEVRRSVASAGLQDPAKNARLEQMVSQIAGRPLRVSIRLVEAPAPPAGQPPVSRPSAPPAPTQPSRVAESAPVFNEPGYLPGEDETPPIEDTYRLYLQQEPNGHARMALRNNPAFREKVEMVQRFFSGRLFDLSGREIVLE